jgi:methyl-accepting chemotaxis protein PixJ
MTTTSESTSALPQAVQPQDKRDLSSKTIGKQSIWSSIQLKATLAAVAIGTLPVVAIGATAYYFANQSMTAQTATAKKVRAVGLIDKVNRFIFERYGDIQIVAGLNILTEDKLRATKTPLEKQAELDRFVKAYQVYDSITVFDLNGDPLISSGGQPFKNHKDRIYFQEALKTDRAYISQPLISTTKGTFNIYFAAPVKDATTGKTIAIVRSRMPVKFLDNAIKNFGTDGDEYYLTNSAKEVFLGPKGEYATKTSSSGENVTSSKKDEFQSVNITSIFPVFEQLAAAKQPESTISGNADSSTEQLLAYAPDKKVVEMPELGWNTIIAINTDLAFAPQRQLLQTLLIGTGIAALLVAAIAVYLARRATRPLIEASAAVEKVGQGELDTRVAVKGEDELALLGTNINQMAGRIKGLLAEAQESSNQIELQNALLEESNALQTDVENILDVVSALEDGDMTVQAEVSDRMTGLVSDTLNRLIEQLGGTLAQVLRTAQQVTEGAKNLQNLNAIVAGNSGEQSQSIVNVLELTENVEKIARESSENVVKSNQSLLVARSAVADGQISMASLTDGFEVLQQGIGDISKRTEELQAFIDLADQFAQEQSQVASMTQMLSLSADQLGAKALAQDDPKEFRMSALEFKAIANQISELSKQAFAGLSSLKQRSGGVQTLVVGVNKEVRDLANLVASFNEIVTQSIQAFAKVQDTTEQVVRVGNTVEQSSQEIVATSQSTAQAMRNIAQLAERTAQLTQTTRTESEQMGNLSDRLLKNIQYFRLPDSTKSTRSNPLETSSPQENEPFGLDSHKPDLKSDSSHIGNAEGADPSLSVVA